ncbi:MAG: hypothetical protein JNK15_04360 [Planctomycetes bacterium]|nr:hypothetical protein [Planctomycetota bacterium]
MVRTSPAPEFVSFHADRPAGAGTAHPHTTLQSLGYMRMLDMLFRSARLFHRGARCTLLTTRDTHVTGIRVPFRRLDQPVDHGRLMLSRSLAQLACVEANDFARPLVLLDSDILMNGSLQPLFAEDFDVALTWRFNKTMPINGGLIVLHNHRPDVARAFYRRFLQCYQERHAVGDNAGWYGDQLALQELVGLDWKQAAAQPRIERDGVRIRLLPCDTWNFSPDNQLAAIGNGLPDKLVLHFKGQRKRLMEPFWDAFLAPRTHWLPWRRRRAEREAVARLQRAIAAETNAPPPPSVAEVDA